MSLRKSLVTLGAVGCAALAPSFARAQGEPAPAPPAANPAAAPAPAPLSPAPAPAPAVAEEEKPAEPFAFGDFTWMWYADMVLAGLAALVNLPIREARVVRMQPA